MADKMIPIPNLIALGGYKQRTAEINGSVYEEIKWGLAKNIYIYKEREKE